MDTSSLTPQDKAINHSIPLYFYHIYEVNNEIYAYLVDWKPAWEAEKDYVSVYHFNGKAAHYWMGTDDASILRRDALSLAIQIHEGKVRKFHTDLSQVSSIGKQK
jgi:hypothetical protein